MARRGPRQGKISPRKRAWLSSAAFKSIRLAGLRKARLAIARGKKCGAHSKSTGEPCKKPPMRNGKCYLHGGKTPKGSNWHKVQWPANTAPIRKMYAKLDLTECRAKKKKAKLAAMSPNEREKYREWQNNHLPGSSSLRERKRRDREAKEILEKLWDR